MKAYFYISQPLVPVESASLERLVAGAEVKNAAYGITGFLCFKEVFIQYFEGEAKEVDALFATIKADARHKILNCLAFDNIECRQFPNWRMKLISRDVLNHDRVEPFLFKQLARAKDRTSHLDKWRKQVWLAVQYIAAQSAHEVAFVETEK